MPPKSIDYCGVKDPYIQDLVTDKLLHHLDCGHIDGPYDNDTLPLPKEDLHYSPVFGFQKPNSEKALLIIHLSAPDGQSINSQISVENRSTSYPQFQDICALATRVGNDGYFWTADALDAYWRIPIAPKYKHLFAIKWLDRTLIFNCLSFGLASAPKIYNKFVKIFIWNCHHYKYDLFNQNNETLILQYLDDFFAGHSNYKKALEQKEFLLKRFKQLSLPTSEKKCAGPSKTIKILGWLISSIGVLTITLTEKKRSKYLNAIKKAIKLKKTNLFYLQKIIGYLRYTINIIPYGKYFFRSLDVMNTKLTKEFEAHITSKYTYHLLNKESLFNLKVWQSIFVNLKNNPIPINFLSNDTNLTIIRIWTDATTTIGIGGVDSLGNWYQYKYSDLNPFTGIYKNYKYKHWNNIQYLELLSIIIMLVKFGNFYTNCKLIIYNDNPTAVKATKKGTVAINNKIFYPLANLIKIIAIKSVNHQFIIECHDIDGSQNGVADALSRYFKRPFNYLAIEFNHYTFVPSPRVPIHNLINKLIAITLIPNYAQIHFIAP